MSALRHCLAFFYEFQFSIKIWAAQRKERYFFGHLFFFFSFFFPSLDPGHGAQTIGWLGLRGALAIGLGSSVVRTLEGKRRKLAV